MEQKIIITEAQLDEFYNRVDVGDKIELVQNIEDNSNITARTIEGEQIICVLDENGETVDDDIENDEGEEE